MTKIIFPLLASFGIFSASAGLPGKNYRFRPEDLKFSYQSYEGDTSYSCQHRIESEAGQDWEVTCGPKRYFVHLWLTEYRRPQIPRLSLELLYWVSDRSHAGSKADAGTSLWFHFKDPSDFYALTVKQGVDNDSAGLYLEIQPR